MKLMDRSLVFALLIGAGAGCSDDDTHMMVDDPVTTPEAGSQTGDKDASLPPVAADAGTDTPDAAPPVQASRVGCDAIEMDAPDDGIQVEMPLPVPGAQEREYCMLFIADRDMNLNWMDGRYTRGSHHANLYQTGYKDKLPTVTRTGATIADPSQPHPCSTPTAVWDVHGVLATGRPADRAKLDAEGNPEPGVKVLPSNVAMKIKKGDVLLANYHMINTTEKLLDSCFKFNMHGIPDADVEHEAGVLFTYNTMITVPPNGEATARLACPVTKDFMLKTAVSHMHERGDGYVANLLDKAPTDPTAKVVTELYAGTEWDDPEVRVFDEPLALKAGQYIDYECHYTNHEDREVAQGYASSDEMCMFSGAYWPRDRAFELCAVEATISANGGASAGIVYGDGDMSGADFLGCLWSLPETVYTGTFDDPKRYDTLSCFTQTCPEASPGLNPYFTCLQLNSPGCTADCTNAQASFQAACSFGACQAKYGSDGSNGTCATEAGPLAVAACTKPAQVAAFTNTCLTGPCAPACTENPTGLACRACMGTFDGSPINTSCMNTLIGACAQDQGKKMATDCVTKCFTDCVTEEVTTCTVSCLNDISCKAEHATLAAATCD